ncbi:aspartate/glutamate racemase family protein [Sphingomonas hankyongi]|uniref:Amino acid racemase n=1 Tax=Sphingomonas hankyongi TaxID=2908209 RepID=A0ABT0S1B3_9SPHN|nr:amino acid racemase [Sphingomonas hankyongi]MCL6729350.1 amino acid racemase [Sphingomonas hankyongi]
MRKLGIVGGASWSSTALYYDHINRGIARELGGMHSARLIIESFDFEDYAAFNNTEKFEAANSMVANAAKRLADAGAQGILLASNTMHRAVDTVEAASGLPVIDIRRVTAERVAADRRNVVALLGTRFTMVEPFARGPYEERGIVIHEVSPSWRDEVDRIIYQELVAGRVVRDSQRKLKTLITELQKQKVQAVVLGCTELVLAVDVRANVLPVYDTTAIHARAAVEWMLDDEQEARAAA